MEAFVNRIIDAARRILHWADERVPRGLRSVLGLLLMIGGLAGFLPVLGFWMIPAGLAMIALDIPPWRRWLKKRIGPGHPSDPTR